MKVTINGNQMEALSASVEGGYAMLPLLDDKGKQVIRQNGEPDALICYGAITIIEEDEMHEIDHNYDFIHGTTQSDSGQEP